MLTAEVTQSGIAREMKVNPSAVHLVIEGKAVSHPIMNKLASCLGAEPREIWPKAYPDGQPRKAGRPASKIPIDTMEGGNGGK